MPSYSREVKIPGKSQEALYDKISSAIERFASDSSIGEIEIEKKPTRLELHLKNKYFQAVLRCEEETVHVDMKLGLLAGAFRSKIDDGIDRWIAKNFS